MDLHILCCASYLIEGLGSSSLLKYHIFVNASAVMVDIITNMICHQRLYLLQCQSRQLMHCDTLKQDNDSTVRGDGGSRVDEVRAGTTSPIPEHKGFKLQ